MGGSRGRSAVRYREPDVGGGFGSGGSIGPRPVGPHGVNLPPAALGGVRKSIAELRAAAELERANQPSTLRYIFWTLAKASGQPFTEVKSLRLKDIPYYAEYLRTGKVPDGRS